MYKVHTHTSCWTFFWMFGLNVQDVPFFFVLLPGCFGFWTLIFLQGFGCTQCHVTSAIFGKAVPGQAVVFVVGGEQPLELAQKVLPVWNDEVFTGYRGYDSWNSQTNFSWKWWFFRYCWWKKSCTSYMVNIPLLTEYYTLYTSQVVSRISSIHRINTNLRMIQWKAFLWIRKLRQAALLLRYLQPYFTGIGGLMCGQLGGSRFWIAKRPPDVVF